jgi:hypothetical protein
MKKLALDESRGPTFAFNQRDDVERIVRVFALRGYEIDAMTAYHAWGRYSDAMCAGWMMLPDDDNEVFLHALSYTVEVE